MSYDFTIRPPEAVHDQFEGNQTYNLTPMLARAGFHPVILNGMTAVMMRRVVSNAYSVMRDNPSYFRQWNPENGWGSYEGAKKFLRELDTYLEGCPDEYVMVVS